MKPGFQNYDNDDDDDDEMIIHSDALSLELPQWMPSDR